MAEYYVWLKAFHIIAVIAWMAGLLYLPRLFVYHVNAKIGTDADRMLQTMERRLLRFIMNPAMILSLVLGLILIGVTGAGAPGTGGWMHAKILCLVGLFASHGMMAKYRKDFERGANRKSERFFRIFNEVPTVLMIAIVILVVVKPF